MTQQNLYFGYGSNLNREDLERKCEKYGRPFPFSAAVGTAWLPDLEPVFDYWSHGRQGGVLDLVPRLGQAAAGVLFEVEPGGWQTLDQKEGAPNFYRRERVTALKSDGSCVAASTYIVCPDKRTDPPVIPNPNYLKVVSRGFGEYGLDDLPVHLAAGGQEIPFQIPRIFVYGTLLSGECRDGFLQADRGAADNLPAAVAGTLHNQGVYPALVCDGDGTVHGELISLQNPTAIFERLDEVEGFGGYEGQASLFRRAIVTARLADGSRLPAWAYLLADQRPGPAIVSGDWRAR